jgi:FolB domain-containing protein
MSRISIVDLEVFCHVGVTEEERAEAQRLLITVDLDFDFSIASVSDRLERTIDYFQVAQELLKFGERRNWKLLEKLAADTADLVLAKFKPQAVTVEVKKFVIPQAKFVSVSLTRSRER